MSLRVIVVGLMLITAIAFGMIAMQINKPSGPLPVASAPQAPAARVASYMVAARPLPPGTLARTEDFTIKTVPVDRVPAGAVMEGEEARASIRGAMVRRYLDAGAPLAPDDLLRPRERGFLAAVLAPSTRAVSIGVDPITGVAGLIWPGDHVDVILTQEIQGAAVRRTVTSETILTNVRVIAVDQDIAQGAPANGTATGRLAATVTLQATADQAEKLAVAGRLGRLSLAVRASSGDGTQVADAIRTVSGADVSPALSSLDISVGSRVQVIQGDQRSEVTFR